MSLPLRPGWRRATAEEATIDRRKRDEVLEAAIAEGLIPKRDVERLRAEVNEFAGYDREIAKDRLSLPKVTVDKTKTFRFPDVSGPVSQPSAQIEFEAHLREVLAVEEGVAAACVVLGCAYAVVRVDDWEHNAITYEYRVVPEVRELRRLDFPSWDAFAAWEDRGRPA